MAEATHEHQEHHHEIDPKLFVRTFMWLTLLMGLTIGAAIMGERIAESNQSALLSYAANAIALTIACWKATLVILNFMGVKHASRLTQVYAAMGFVWVTLMGIVICDYATRHWEPEASWEKVPPSPNTQIQGPRMDNPFAVEGH